MRLIIAKLPCCEGKNPERLSEYETRSDADSSTRFFFLNEENRDSSDDQPARAHHQRFAFLRQAAARTGGFVFSENIFARRAAFW
jgi:hypothetical protein